MPEPTAPLRCPTCHKPVRWSQANKHRPFCSERCRLIDFGDWVDERNRIPGEPLEYFSVADPERP